MPLSEGRDLLFGTMEETIAVSLRTQVVMESESNSVWRLILLLIIISPFHVLLFADDIFDGL